MFKDYIPEAFPHGRDLILDSEVLLIDVKTGKPLPFGSLGIHKVIPDSSMSEQEVFLFMCKISLINAVVLVCCLWYCSVYWPCSSGSVLICTQCLRESICLCPQI
jgi:hypothetical protein